MRAKLELIKYTTRLAQSRLSIHKSWNGLDEVYLKAGIEWIEYDANITLRTQ